MKTQSFGRGAPIYHPLVGRGRGRGRGRASAVVLDNPVPFANRFEKPFVLGVIEALLDYRHCRENGESEDNLEIFPSAGFENLKISSVTNKPGDFWPDQSGRYWWRLTLEDGSINEEFSWAEVEDNDSGFTVYGPNDVKIEGFSWEEDDYGMSHHVEYTECKAIREWMKRKDQNWLARIESTQPRYISVPQGRTCRYDSNMVLPNAPIAGLYSDDFSICCAVILYKKDALTGQVKISYTHVDQLVKYTQILKELQWFGGAAQMFLYYKSTAFEGGVLEQILTDFEPEAFEQKEWGDGEDNFGLAITLDGMPKYFSRSNLPKLIAHPQEWSVNAFYQINLAMTLIDKQIDSDSDEDSDEDADSDSPLQNQRLLFDGCAWQEPLVYDTRLNPSGEKFYHYMLDKLPRAEDFSGAIVLPIINSYFKSRLGRDMLMTLTKSFLILAVENNYQLLFNNDLADLLKRVERERVPKAISGLLEEISLETKGDFTLLASFMERIDDILTYYKNSKIKSELMGLYKLYLRFQHKDSNIDIRTMVQPFTSSSSSSSSSATPPVEFQAVHEGYNPDANSQHQQSPTRTAPNFATFSYPDGIEPKEAESLSAQKEEANDSPRFG